MENTIYNVAKENLGKHLTLDNSVPQDVGCAECVSFILKNAGIAIPKNGIPGTASLLAWLQANPDFVGCNAEEGAIIINATGTGNESIEGHCGIVGAYGAMYVDDFGILSNDSDTGTLREHWSLSNWLAYYETAGGMKTWYFKPLS